MNLELCNLCEESVKAFWIAIHNYIQIAITQLQIAYYTKNDYKLCIINFLFVVHLIIKHSISCAIRFPQFSSYFHSSLLSQEK